MFWGKARRAVYCAGGFVVLWLASAVLLIYSGNQVALPANNPSREFAIVLLAGTAEERVPHLVSLYAVGATGRVLLTDDGVRKGWSRAHQRNLYSIERTEEQLVKRGIPLSSIVRLPFFKSGTIYDALAVREYVTTHNIRSMLLVTSDYHARRTQWIFARVFAGRPITIATAAAPSKNIVSLAILLEPIKFVYYYLRFGLLSDPAAEN